MRYDLKIIADWIKPGSRVLDLGCGNGDLLYNLAMQKQVRGSGIEINEDDVAACIEKGISVLQGDIDSELSDFPNDAFDYVILSQTLQQVFSPARVIKQMLRIGKQGIVSFPNFSHWRVRLQLLLTGHAPITRQLPYEWHETPNIRVLSIKDFEAFARQLNFRVINSVSMNHVRDKGRTIRHFENCLAEYGIFLIG
ncbi:methionine biosynthesis protein MetW [Desulfobacterales bacterium HSG17]|nr:methionine biosynthesis protein MetW [Desulfobacterales bacterium HSG17]